MFEAVPEDRLASHGSEEAIFWKLLDDGREPAAGWKRRLYEFPLHSSSRDHTTEIHKKIQFSYFHWAQHGFEKSAIFSYSKLDCVRLKAGLVPSLLNVNDPVYSLDSGLL